VPIRTTRNGKKNRPSLSSRFWDDLKRPSPRPMEGGQGNQPTRWVQDDLQRAVRLRLLRLMHLHRHPLRTDVASPSGAPDLSTRSWFPRPPVHVSSDDPALPSTFSHLRSISPTACPRHLTSRCVFFFHLWSRLPLSFGVVPMLWPTWLFTVVSTARQDAGSASGCQVGMAQDG
jgi:hypothetical protein